MAMLSVFTKHHSGTGQAHLMQVVLHGVNDCNTVGHLRSIMMFVMLIVSPALLVADSRIPAKNSAGFCVDSLSWLTNSSTVLPSFGKSPVATKMRACNVKASWDVSTLMKT